MHILLVEDNEHDIFFVQQALRELPQPVNLSVVQDGEQALAFLFLHKADTQVEQPDLILLDLNLPKKSGFEVLAALEHDPQLKFLPVIILTTSTRPEDITRCYKLGANAYFEKPIGLDSLFALLRTTVEFWSGCKFRTRAHKHWSA